MNTPTPKKPEAKPEAKGSCDRTRMKISSSDKKKKPQQKSETPTKKRSPVLLDSPPKGSYWGGMLNGNRRRVKAKRPSSLQGMPPPVAKKPKVENYDDRDFETDLDFSQAHGY